MKLDILSDSLDDSWPGTDKLRGLKRRVLGDPRRAPGRILGGLVFLLILALVIGALYVISSTAESSGSSLWLVRVLTDIVGTLWFAVPVAVYLYYKYLGRRRSRYAAQAAEHIGWLTTSVKQLSDEVRTTDRTTRIIATTDDSYEAICDAVDTALDGESHPFESVDYYGRGQDSDDAPADASELPAEETAAESGDPFDGADAPDDGTTDDNPFTTDTEGAADPFERLDPPDDEALSSDAFVTTPDADDEQEQALSHRERARRAIAHASQRALDAALTGLETAWRGARKLVAFAVATVTRLFGLVTSILAYPLVRLGLWSRDAAADADTKARRDDHDDEVPWRIRFSEEVKHFVLDFSAGYRSDDVRWRFVFPAVVTMATLLLVARVWVRPVTFVLFIGFSLVVGLAVFWSTNRLRSRRVRKYRQGRGGGHWDDVAGLVKTVETADTTAYVGFMAGRTYATYDREEFVTEFALRMWQHTHNERVAPSILEQYARNLAMMKPNLQGHRENVEIPAIQRRLKEVVETTEDKVVEKAELAFRVIEPVGETIKFERSLGHDPRLVAAEYRWMVEAGGVLSEMDVEMPAADGEDTEVTLVYPSEKTRLPDIQQIHSRLSDRFHGLQGDPFYRLPSVDPARHLTPFQATPRAWDELPESGPNGHTTVSD
ncbi:hypothetical protein [Haloarcula sp. JP-L23]|uniref:hypothetical protein n=1 Tax=Haloarcula sp. JP-L23 TaxID=2716717 RepID=UPI00140F0F9A|nr:hypothetical protein G9465_24555 [Haloarcula sp. JP-L23]